MTPTKTAMMELIERYKALPKPASNFTAALIDAFIKSATELLETEKTQIVDAFQTGHWNAEDWHEPHDGGEYYSQTYKQ